MMNVLTLKNKVLRAQVTLSESSHTSRSGHQSGVAHVQHVLAMIGVLAVCMFLIHTAGEVTGERILIQDVRLVNGASSASGRLEVRVDNQWGTVCDDQWNYKDAAVACRVLGYPNGGKEVNLEIFGRGSGSFCLDDIFCDGSETTLNDCLTSGSLITLNVNRNKDVGVACDTSFHLTTTAVSRVVATKGVPSNVRLAGFKYGIGILEVYSQGVWGSVCDDSFDERAAQVVCRSLNYNPVNARPSAPRGDFGSPRFPIKLDDVRCRGNEFQILECPHSSWGSHNCGPTEVATVTCVHLNSEPAKPPVPILECRDGYMFAAFSKSKYPLLNKSHLTVADPNRAPCNVLYSADNDTVIVRVPFDSCGTKVTHNATHIIYTNAINYNLYGTTGTITRVNSHLVKVFCEIPRRDTVTRFLQPWTQAVTQKNTGHFTVTMTFYRNNSFTNPANELPLRIPLGEWLNVALEMKSIDNRLKLVVPDCKATPDGNMDNPVSYPLFENSCPREDTLTLYNLAQRRFGYRYQPFMFVGYHQVYLHCSAFVCLVSDGSAECDRSCNSTKSPSLSRRKREAPSFEKVLVHSGPIVVLKLKDTATFIERIGQPELKGAPGTSSRQATSLPRARESVPPNVFNGHTFDPLTSSTTMPRDDEHEVTMMSRGQVTLGQPDVSTSRPVVAYLVERIARPGRGWNTHVSRGVTPIQASGSRRLLMSLHIPAMAVLIMLIATAM